MYLTIGTWEHLLVLLIIQAPTHKQLPGGIYLWNPCLTGNALTHNTMKHTTSIFIRCGMLSKRSVPIRPRVIFFTVLIIVLPCLRVPLPQWCCILLSAVSPSVFQILHLLWFYWGFHSSPSDWLWQLLCFNWSWCHSLASWSPWDTCQSWTPRPSSICPGMPCSLVMLLFMQMSHWGVDALPLAPLPIHPAHPNSCEAVAVACLIGVDTHTPNGLPFHSCSSATLLCCLF